MPFKPPALLRNLWSTISRRPPVEQVSLNVVGSLMLTQKDRLWVLEIGESWIVVGSGTNGLTSLAHLRKGGLPITGGILDVPFDLEALKSSGALNLGGRNNEAPEQVESIVAPAPAADCAALSQLLETASVPEPEPEPAAPAESTGYAPEEVASDMRSDKPDEASAAPDAAPVAPMVAAKEPDVVAHLETVSEDFPDPATVAEQAAAEELATEPAWAVGTSALGSDPVLLEMPEELLMNASPAIEAPVDGMEAAELQASEATEIEQPSSDEFESVHASLEDVVTESLVESPCIDASVVTLADAAGEVAPLDESAPDSAADLITADDSIPVLSDVVDESYAVVQGAAADHLDDYSAMQDEVLRFAGEMSQLESEQAATVAAQSAASEAALASQAAVEVDASGFPDPASAAIVEMVATDRLLAAEGADEARGGGEARFQSTAVAEPDDERESPVLSVEPDEAAPSEPLTFVQMYAKVKTNAPR
jgi:hypothetical protein